MAWSRTVPTVFSRKVPLGSHVVRRTKATKSECTKSQSPYGKLQLSWTLYSTTTSTLLGRDSNQQIRHTLAHSSRLVMQPGHVCPWEQIASTGAAWETRLVMHQGTLQGTECSEGVLPCLVSIVIPKGERSAHGRARATEMMVTSAKSFILDEANYVRFV
jgi:hypothetical protein